MRLRNISNLTPSHGFLKTSLNLHAKLNLFCHVNYVRRIMYMSMRPFGFALHKTLVFYVDRFLFCFLRIPLKVIYHCCLYCMTCIELMSYDDHSFFFLRFFEDSK